MSMKVKVDKEKCIGCGLCVSLADKSFRLNEKEFKAEVIEPVGDSQDKIESAIESCPVNAISINE